MIVPQYSLSLLVNSFASVVNYHLLVDNALNPIHVRLQHMYSHGLDYTGFSGFFTKTLGSYIWPKLRKIMLCSLTQFPDL